MKEAKPDNTFMRFMNLHAHYDDFEFTAAGSFENARQQLGEQFSGLVTVCTDGAAGHFSKTREETAAIRLEEQLKALELAHLDLELLTYPDDSPIKEGCMVLDPPLLASMWRSIRNFEPDYLFCPPLPNDNQAGVHPDHLAVAEATRRIAYLINVPLAYQDFYPNEVQPPFAPKNSPVILTTTDSYMGIKDAFDLAVDITTQFDLIAQMSWCHQSQIAEWLPWVGKHHLETPQNFDDWTQTLKVRMQARQERLGLPTDRFYEMFCVTAWGQIPSIDQLVEDLPSLDANHSNLDHLENKIQGWLSQGA